MTEEQMKNEKLYYISLSVLRSMLENGVISVETHRVFCTKLLEEYRPVSGTLMAGIPLDLKAGQSDVCNGKPEKRVSRNVNK